MRKYKNVNITKSVRLHYYLVNKGHYVETIIELEGSL